MIDLKDIHYYTQSEPDNCWQTAIACLIKIDPVKLPPQSELSVVYKKTKILESYGSYRNIINAYLEKHHGMVYFEIDKFKFDGVRPRAEHFVLIGPTVRTTQPENVQHCVVGRMRHDTNYLTQVWDVHPSRDGLTDITQWGIVAPKVSMAEEHHVKYREHLMKTNESYRLVYSCLCPACGLEELRIKANHESAVNQIMAELGK